MIAVAGIGLLAALHNWNPKPIYLAGSLQNRVEPTQSGIYSRSPERTVVMDLPEEPTGPKWLDTSTNPPLSAADAIRIANEVRKTINPEHDQSWQFQSANLCPWKVSDGYWYWEVRYILPSSGSPYEFTAVIMMDGTPATPVTVDDE